MRLASLVVLQTLDSRVHALRRERDALPRALAATETRVAQAKAAEDEFQQRIKKSRMEIDRRSLDLKSREARIVQLEGQLNQAKTNKEYAVLKKEIDGHKADNGVLEDEILQLYGALEEKEKEGRGVTETYRAAAGELETARRASDAAVAAIDREIDGLQKEREAAAAGLDPDLLKSYRRILDGKPDGLAIVPVVDGVCRGCYMDLTSQEINLLLMDRDVQYCKRCCRIMYIPKEPAAAVGEKGK